MGPMADSIRLPMAFLLFIDESGHDHGEAPYEVLAGVAVDDARTWNLITAIQAAETAHFGQRITHGSLELKGKKLLKTKTFRLAQQMPDMAPEDRRRLAQECLAEGRAAVSEGRPSRVSRAQLTALAQAKLAFVQALLTICAQHGVRAFASVVDDGPRPTSDFLRKDYSYLFERFFYFLESQPRITRASSSSTNWRRRKAICSWTKCAGISKTLPAARREPRASSPSRCSFTAI